MNHLYFAQQKLLHTGLFAHFNSVTFEMRLEEQDSPLNGEWASL